MEIVSRYEAGEHDGETWPVVGVYDALNKGESNNDRQSDRIKLGADEKHKCGNGEDRLCDFEEFFDVDFVGDYSTMQREE